MITIFEHEVHLWNPKQNHSRDKTDTGGNVQKCVKWNLKGDKFALGLNYYSFGLWDTKEKKVTDFKTLFTQHR